MAMNFQEIITFWFEEIDSKKWWIKDPDFDQLLMDRFSTIHAKAAACELYHWRTCAEGRLAEIIVLDQFSRNMFRDSAKAFANDTLALSLAQHAIELGLDQQLPTQQRSFMYLPYMHSESLVIHEQAVKLYEKMGVAGNLDFEYKHKAIIDRFGRYPHRNAVLGRESTSEELAFLQQPGSSF